MCLIYDVVVNHVRPVHSMEDLAAVVPFNQPSHFNLLGQLRDESFDDYLQRPGMPPNAISTFGCCGCSAGDMMCSGAEGYNDTIVERGWFFDLADLNHSNAFVALSLSRWISEMVANYSIDALRLDTAPYVPRDFLREFRQSAGIEIFGEVTTSNYSFLADYQKVLGGVMNFKLGYAIRESFCPLREAASVAGRLASNGNNFTSGSSISGSSKSSVGGDGGEGLASSDGSVRRVAMVLKEITLAESAGLLAPDLMVNLIDSHDMSRVAHKCGGDLVRVSNAIALMMMLPGIPMIMYGTEWSFVSDQSHTRASLWTSRFNATAAPLYDFIRQLNALRRQGHSRWAALSVSTADDSSLVLRLGVELDSLWLFVSRQPASHVSRPRRYCASGLHLASRTSEWAEVLYPRVEDTRAEFDVHGCYMARDGWPKVLMRRHLGSKMAAAPRVQPLPVMISTNRPSLAQRLSSNKPSHYYTTHVIAIYTNETKQDDSIRSTWLRSFLISNRNALNLQLQAMEAHAFFEGGGIREATAGSVVLLSRWALVEGEGRLRDTLRSVPRLWTLLNASMPLQIILHDDSHCSIEWPRDTHHIVYRDVWQQSWHREWRESRVYEGAQGVGKWPWLRSIPYGTAYSPSNQSAYDAGILQNLNQGQKIGAAMRSVLFSFRGTSSYYKPSRSHLMRAVQEHAREWQCLSRRLMSHALPPPPGLDRYIIDVKDVNDRTPFTTAGLVSYLDLLHISVFSVSPPGDSWEAYRTYEAIEAGSIPVILDSREYKRGRCIRPAAHLLDTAASFIVSVRRWDELGDVLQAIAVNVSMLEMRQQAMLSWLRNLKSELIREIRTTSQDMANHLRHPIGDNTVASRSWRPPTRGDFTPLSPPVISKQQNLLADYWRKPQPAYERLGGMGIGFGQLDVPRLFQRPNAEGEPGLCDAPVSQSFRELCLSSCCELPLVRNVSFGTADVDIMKR